MISCSNDEEAQILCPGSLLCGKNEYCRTELDPECYTSFECQPDQYCSEGKCNEGVKRDMACKDTDECGNF